MLADSSSEIPTIAVEFESAWVSRSTRPTSLRNPSSCWISSTSLVTAGVTAGLPSRSPPTQRAEAQDGGREVEHDAVTRELVVEVLEERGHRAVVELGQVVEDVLGLVLGSETTDADLVRLPEQQNRLAKPRDEAPFLGRGRVGSELLDEMGDVEELRQHRAPRRLGRVRGEHGPELEAAERRRDALGVDPVSATRSRASRSQVRSARRAWPSSAVRWTCSVTLASWK